jgi:transposase
MEDVLHLLAEPYDPKRPVVCFDEQPVQLLADVRQTLPVSPGEPERQDYEYKRQGTANIFMTVEPLAGWRHVETTEHRTTLDFAAQMRQIVDVYYGEAERIRIILDNLNTHKPASLYAAYAPEEAFRILQRLEFHYTPKHASWLNPAECELSALTGQCLNRRIPDLPTLREEAGAWEAQRNEERVMIHWRFGIREARTKLHRLYPTLSTIINGTAH